MGINFKHLEFAASSFHQSNYFANSFSSGRLIFVNDKFTNLDGFFNVFYFSNRWHIKESIIIVGVNPLIMGLGLGMTIQRMNNFYWAEKHSFSSQ